MDTSVMIKKNSEQSIDSCFNEWEQAVAAGRYEEALMPALTGYMVSRSEGDKVHEMMLLSYLKIATDKAHERLFPKYDRDEGRANFSDTCSFCCREFGEMPHVLGANVSICAECIKFAWESIRSKEIGR